MNNKFAERLKLLLSEKNLTQKEFAKELAVSQACVTFWVNGVKQPTAENIFNACKILETTADFLLGLTDFE